MPCGWVSSETGGRDCALSGRDLRVFFFSIGVLVEISPEMLLLGRRKEEEKMLMSVLGTTTRGPSEWDECEDGPEADTDEFVRPERKMI